MLVDLIKVVIWSDYSEGVAAVYDSSLYCYIALPPSHNIRCYCNQYMS
jgi:hypothetical protein